MYNRGDEGSKKINGVTPVYQFPIFVRCHLVASLWFSILGELFGHYDTVQGGFLEPDSSFR